MQPALNSALNPRSQNKAGGHVATQISPHGALTKITHRLEQIRKLGRPQEFKAYTCSPEYKSLYAALDDHGCDRVIDALVDAKRSCFSGKSIPWKLNYRVAWTETMIQRLRAAEAKFGNDYDIARELQLPLKVVRPARWRYCGRRRVRNQPYKKGLASGQVAA